MEVGRDWNHVTCAHAPWLRLDAHQLQVLVLEPHLSAVNIIPDTARVNQLESEYVISGTETVAGDASNEAVA